MLEGVEDCSQEVLGWLFHDWSFQLCFSFHVFDFDCRELGAVGGAGVLLAELHQELMADDSIKC